MRKIDTWTENVARYFILSIVERRVAWWQNQEIIPSVILKTIDNIYLYINNKINRNTLNEISRDVYNIARHFEEESYFMKDKCPWRVYITYAVYYATYFHSSVWYAFKNVGSKIRYAIIYSSNNHAEDLKCEENMQAEYLKKVLYST